MKKTALRSPQSAAPVSAGIRVCGLAFYGKNWLLDCEVRQHSAQVLSTRGLILSKLEWFFQMRGHDVCGQTEVREFLAYLGRGHAEPGGRWGNPHLTRPVRPRAVKDYHGHLRTFFRWLIAAFIWDDTARTNQHDEMVQAMKQIDGVSDAVVVSLPGNWA